MMELETGLKHLVLNFGKERAKKKDVCLNSENIGLSFTDESKDSNLQHTFNFQKSNRSATNASSSDLYDDVKFSVQSDVVDTGLSNKLAQNSSVSGNNPSKNDEDVGILDSSCSEKISGLKRKRESLSGLLHWISDVAKNPLDPTLGELPNISKWRTQRSDEYWMHVLSAREALRLKRPEVLSAEQVGSQKRQKMHPSMYDDPAQSSSRVSPGTSSCSSASDVQSSPSSIMEGMEDQRNKRLLRSHSLVKSIFDCQSKKRIPVGRYFQAEIPEWTGVESETDSKWLGYRIWPIEKRVHSLIERDPVGKGRIDTCGCEYPSSVDCVRFHIAEKSKKVKLEFETAFYQWNFDKMGEVVALSWTETDEKKFEAEIKSSFQYLDMWDQLVKKFPTKSREDLVSYYFNVYLLRRRGYQNRYTPCDVGSDDEDEDVIGKDGSGTLTAVPHVSTPY